MECNDVEILSRPQVIESSIDKNYLFEQMFYTKKLLHTPKHCFSTVAAA